MDEVTLIYQTNVWIEGATVHFTAMTTFVVIYIAGLYAFLRNAPLPVKVIAYLFFVGSFLVYVRMGIAYFETLYVQTALNASHAGTPEASDAFRQYVQSEWYDTVPVGALWYILVFGTVIALGWLTFFYHWKQKGEA